MSPVFKLGAQTIAACGVCGGSVFADEHVVRDRDGVNHAACVLYPPRKAAAAAGGGRQAGARS